MAAERIHYFDWLRAAAVLGVVVYHALGPFTDGWWINNAERSELLTSAMLFFETFGLGLLFLLAGASVRFARRTRSAGELLRERAARLLIPFAVGALLFTPPMMYLAAVHDGSTSASFAVYLTEWPAWMARWALDIGFSPKVFEVGFHLWFLGWLFAFSALGLPIFALLRSARGRSFVDGLARAAAGRAPPCFSPCRSRCPRCSSSPSPRRSASGGPSPGTAPSFWSATCFTPTSASWRPFGTTFGLPWWLGARPSPA
jgi:peptidoglycan/LPS O-acetylase OafA/YrhL